MSLNDKIDALSSLAPVAVGEVRKSKWTLKDVFLIPLRGTIGGYANSNVKERYFSDDPSAFLSKDKVQRSAEIWLGIIGAASTYLAYKGTGFNHYNPLLELGVKGASWSFLGYVCYGVADNIFRLTWHYNRKKKPATLTNELLYYFLIKKTIGEERFFSFIDGAMEKVNEFYYLNLPSVPLPR